MNIYDTKQIKCYKCDKFIGEVDIDAEIACPKCGDCANLFPYGEDKLLYAMSYIVNNRKTRYSSK